MLDSERALLLGFVEQAQDHFASAEFGGDLGCAALRTLGNNDATVVALGGSADEKPLRLCEFDGHGLAFVSFRRLGLSSPSLTQAPDRRDPGGEG
jgi:hypothetical protein